MSLHERIVRDGAELSLASLAEAHFAWDDIMPDLDECRETALAHATPAFAATEPRALLPVAIAADQERPETVRHGLNLFVEQLSQNPPPFWLVVSSNRRPGQDGTIIRETIRSFQRAHPELPLTFFETVYEPGTSIGRIKKDSADVAIDLARHRYGAQLPEQLAILTQDIDIERLSPHFLRRIVTPLDNGYALAQGNMRHARNGFPNMDRVLFWYDLAILMNHDALHDNVNAITLRAFLEGGGYDPADLLFEGIKLQRRAAAGSLYNGVGLTPFQRLKRQPGAFALYSPRRAYLYLQSDIPPTEMWEGDFADVAGHRQRATDTWEDISNMTAKEMISDMIRQGAFTDRRSLQTHYGKLTQHYFIKYMLEYRRERGVDVSDELRASRRAERRVREIVRIGGAVLEMSGG